MTADWDRFLIFTLILIGDSFFGNSVGFFFGCFFDNSSKAVTGGLLIMLPYIVFGGYLVNLKTVGWWIRWISYLSPLRYSAEALLRNELENNSKYEEGNLIIEYYNYDGGLPG